MYFFKIIFIILTIIIVLQSLLLQNYLKINVLRYEEKIQNSEISQ